MFLTRRYYTVHIIYVYNIIILLYTARGDLSTAAAAVLTTVRIEYPARGRFTSESNQLFFIIIYYIRRIPPMAVPVFLSLYIYTRFHDLRDIPTRHKHAYHAYTQYLQFIYNMYTTRRGRMSDVE